VSGNGMMTNFLRPFFRKARGASFALPGAVSDRARILAIDAGDLTDLLFHIPLIDAIRRRYPGSRIDFLLPESHAPLVVPSGLARQCLVYNQSQLHPWRPAYGSLLRSLGKTGYDVALVMALERQSTFELAALASGAALRCGPGDGKSWPGINCEVTPPADDSRYRGDRPAYLAPFLGLPTDDLRPGWPLPEDRLRQTAQLIHFNKPAKHELLVGVDAGLGKCGKGIAQQNLHFIVRQIESQVPCRVLPLADPANEDRLKRFELQLGNVPPGLHRDTLLETVLLLSQCDLFVAGNTDLFHFAVAQGVPTIGLFTAEDTAEWDPGDSGRARVVRVTRGERVDIETLMAAIEAVTGGRSNATVTVMRVEEDEAEVPAVAPDHD